MNKATRVTIISAALAAAIGGSIYAASYVSTLNSESKVTSTSISTSTVKTTPVFRGGMTSIINDDVLALLKLDAAAVQSKLAAGTSLLAIAKEQGVTEQALKDALTTAYTAHEATELTAFTSNLDTLINSTSLDMGRGFGVRTQTVDVHIAVANVFGLTEDQLKAELAAGKTISTLATANNLTTAQLTDKIKAELDKLIDAAVTAATLTADQATQMKSTSATTAAALASGQFGFGHINGGMLNDGMMGGHGDRGVRGGHGGDMMH